MFTSLSTLTDSQKQELVASLASILAASSEGGVQADKLEAIATAAGCSLSGAYASLFAQVMSQGDLAKLCAGPGSGGGGGYVQNTFGWNDSYPLQKALTLMIISHEKLLHTKRRKQ